MVQFSWVIGGAAPWRAPAHSHLRQCRRKRFPAGLFGATWNRNHDHRVRVSRPAHKETHRRPEAHAPLGSSARRTAHCSPLTAHRSPLTAHCSLLTAHCSLLTAHCSLLTAHCSLLTAHCSLLRSAPVCGANAHVTQPRNLSPRAIPSSRGITALPRHFCQSTLAELPPSRITDL